MTKDGTTAKHRNRRIRQEALREQLAAQGHEQHLIETLKKLADLDEEYDSLEIQRLKIAADLRIKLMAKYLPDLKSTEITGADGKDLVLQVQRKRFDGND